MNWMNLPEEYRKEDSYFCVLPIRFEGKVTYGKGSSNGPDSIIAASQHLEYYDCKTKTEAFEKGIVIKDLGKMPEKNEEMIALVKEQYPKHNFVIALGGDHSVTAGCVDAQEEDVDVLILDAHSDLRDSWNDSQVNHGCVSKYLARTRSVGIVGVRSQDVDEVELQPENVHVLYAWEYTEEQLRSLLSQLKKKIYLSIDVDVFDPSFIRNTGTPEPGGFLWNDVMKMLETVFKEKEVVASDIVEFSGDQEEHVESYALAKLAYRLMNLKI